MKRLSFAPIGLAVACTRAPEPVLVPPPPQATARVASSSAAPSDPLAERPPVPEPGPFVPEAPLVFEGPSGSKVWLIERHNLPLVAVAAVTPIGAAEEPIDKAGLAHVTADMMDEGAGTRDALAFSAAIESIGATFGASADRDKSFATMTFLSSHLDEGLGLLGDAIVRPKHDPKDFARVSSLWKNAVRSRGDDPNEVARLVTMAAFFGEGTPYGHPASGTLASTGRVRREDVEKFHRAAWRPDRTTFVVVGDVTRAKLEGAFAKSFVGWTTPKDAPLDPPAPASDRKPPRTVVVDRPDAPQVVLTIIRGGVTAESPDRPKLDLLNIALGGSFTSRLNQDLREAHGWTYGAWSRFTAQRRVGTFLARAAIRTDAITDALKAMLGDIGEMARAGLSEDEIAKARALARAEAVEAYGNVDHLAASLAENAALGLPPDQDAKDLVVQAAVMRGDLVPLASRWLAIEDATIVMVGPKAAILAALDANGLPAPEVRDVEGNPVNEAPKKRERRK